jgi:hypothetical protein
MSNDHYAREIIKRWEYEDRRRPARTDEDQMSNVLTFRPRPYRTPEATVDAFFYVVRFGDAPRLAAWLDDHPRDREFLINLLKDVKNG